MCTLCNSDASFDAKPGYCQVHIPACEAPTPLPEKLRLLIRRALQGYRTDLQTSTMVCVLLAQFMLPLPFLRRPCSRDLMLVGSHSRGSGWLVRCCAEPHARRGVHA